MSVLRDISQFGARLRAFVGTWSTFGQVGAGAASIGDALGSAINAGANSPTSNIVMVYACVTARRDAIGGVDFHLERPGRNGSAMVESGPLADLIAKPNRDMLWGEYVRAIETHLTLYNVSAIYIDSDGRKPIALVPLHPAGLEIVHGIYAPTGTPTVVGWRYSDPVTGQQRTFEREQVVIHRGYNPDAPLAALSAIAPLKRTILNDNGIREANLALLKNDSTPSFLLSATGLSTREQARELQQAWQDQNAGISNRRKVSVVWGQAKAEKLGLTPQEMEFLAGLSALRQDYYRVFRVTPAMVFDLIGETGLSQGSATDEQIRMWWEMSGNGELAIIEALHNEILSRFPALAAGAALVADSSRLPVFVRARQAKVKDLQTLVSMGYRPDDVSEYLDLDLPAHADNAARVPFSMSVIGDDLDAPASLALGDGATGAEKALRALERALEGTGRAGADALRKQLDTLRTGMLKIESKRWSRFWLEQRGRVLAGVSRLPAREERDWKRWTHFWDNAKGLSDQAAKDLDRSGRDAALDDLLGKIFDATAENAALAARLSPIWANEYQQGWEFANAELGVPADSNPFQIQDHRIKAALDNWTVKGQLANDTTADALRKILGDAIDEGLSNADLGDKIADYYQANCVGDKSARPQTAARTQINGIVNESRLLAASDLGGLVKVWNHGAPDEPRPTHVAAAQQYAAGIALDAKFQLGAYECDAPGAANLPADETCNCGCYLTFKQAGEG